jgi:hypothetical protein
MAKERLLGPATPGCGCHLKGLHNGGGRQFKSPGPGAEINFDHGPVCIRGGIRIAPTHDHRGTIYRFPRAHAAAGIPDFSCSCTTSLPVTCRVPTREKERTLGCARPSSARVGTAGDAVNALVDMGQDK